MHQLRSTTCGTCSFSACLLYGLSQMHWLFLLWPAKFLRICLSAANIYIEATVLIIQGLSFGGMHQIPSTTCGTCSLRACPQYGLSLMHCLHRALSNFPLTCLLAADIYKEATVLIIWGLSLGEMHQLQSTTTVPAPFAHFYCIVCQRVTVCYRFALSNVSCRYMHWSHGLNYLRIELWRNAPGIINHSRYLIFPGMAIVQYVTDALIVIV